MGEYFRGGRRKAGAVTLVMVLFFLAVWGWSQDNASSFEVWKTNTTQSVFLLHPDGFELFHGEIAFVLGRKQLNGIWEVDVSHWTVITPLTLLSAWLLLPKPRQSKSNAPVNPIPETAA